MKWSYGVTTVAERFEDLLPKTLASLATAGFDEPRLFIDGATEVPDHLRHYDITYRPPPNIRTFGNWVLSAWELYLREPTADRYAIFQDDFVTYNNLRAYLERVEYPEKTYLNLYTFPREHKERSKGFYPSRQHGKGAVALVFSNEALRVLLATEHMVNRPLSAKRGWRAVDGGIVETMRKLGWREMVHNPSLVQHTGDISTMKNRPHPKAPAFMGEDFDALDLLT